MSRYLAIEGGDGSGKSTIAGALARRLEAIGHQTIIVREPGTTRLGEEVRNMLLHGEHMVPWAEAYLFAAQRAQLTQEVVAPALSAGQWVISDRSYFSSVAYQGSGRGLGMESVREVNEAGLEGVEPDRVFVLDVPIDVALSRQHRPDRIGSEESAFHRRVLEAYRHLASSEPNRVFLVDNTLGVEKVVDQIMGYIDE